MKTNFKSKLFEKKINLAEANFIFGATGGCTHTSYTQGGCDTLTTTYDDNGKKIKQVATLNCE